MPKSRGGFTLIELLITVSIIVVLSAIGLVIYSTVMKQGRDSKRQTDLLSLQSSLEQYYADQGFYPTSAGASNLDNLLTQTPPPAFTSSIGLGSGTPPPTTKTYQNNPPQDPTGAVRYRYEAISATPPCDNSSSNKCTSYCLYANLENSNPGRPASCTNASYNFALTLP